MTILSKIRYRFERILQDLALTHSLLRLVMYKNNDNVKN